MKLSPEAKGYVEALLHKATYEIALWLEDDHRRVSTMWTMTNPRFTEFAGSTTPKVSDEVSLR